MIVSNKANDLDENPKIIALMFCEFDIEKGSKILHQVPNEVINKTTFDSISSYIVPKIQLKNHIITITVGKTWKVCGFPIYIEHTKYKRNQYIFNICFIFDQNTNTCSYEAVVKKLACDLRTLEVESGFLSNEKMKMQDLPKILNQVRENLNNNGECIIQKIANLEHSAIFLKLIKNHIDPQIVQSFDVPVFVIHNDSFQIEDWDLTTQKILQSINGFKTVSMIANETNIANDVVKDSIKNLLYENILMLVPVIQYSSMFVKTYNLTKFYSDHQVQMDSIFFVQLDKDIEPPTFYDIFSFYNLFNNGITVHDINEIYPTHEKNIDIKKAILFGLIKGYLKKINKYPISLQEPQTKIDNSKKWLTGMHNYDKICSSLGMSIKTIDEQLDEDFNIVICLK